MASAANGSSSCTRWALPSSTPLLSSTPLVALPTPVNAAPSPSGITPLPIIRPPPADALPAADKITAPSVAQASPLISLVTLPTPVNAAPSQSGITVLSNPPPSIRSPPTDAPPATNQSTTPSTAQASSGISSPITSSPAKFTISPSATATAPPVTVGASGTTRLPSPPSSSPPKSTGLSSPASTSPKPTPSPAVPSKASANNTTGLGSSRLPLPHAVASNPANATNVTSAIPGHVNGSALTHTFVPQVSTSIRVPYVSTTPSPTITPSSVVNSSGFLANHGAVAGVSVVVALAALGLSALLFFGLRRRCRRSPRGSTGGPTLPMIGGASRHNDMHYRRVSQILGNGIGAGASRPLSGSIMSEDSHTFSRDTHRSTDPMIPTNPFLVPRDGAMLSQGYAHESTTEYHNTIPFPPPTKPSTSQSQASLQSCAESSPSIYPPTRLADGEEEEENYWRRQGFEPIASPPESDRVVEKHAPQQQPTPPESMLGLWFSGSQSTFRHGSEEENELVRQLHPAMEPSSVHKGSTAPIASPPKVQLRDGRYPVF